MTDHQNDPLGTTLARSSNLVHIRYYYEFHCRNEGSTATEVITAYGRVEAKLRFNELKKEFDYVSARVYQLHNICLETEDVQLLFDKLDEVAINSAHRRRQSAT